MTERLVPLSELPNHIPQRNGRKLGISTGYRWTLHGVRGAVLESIQLGGSRFTSVEAIQRFVTELTRRRDGQPVSERTPPCRQRRRDKVEAELDRIGI
jgi:hypothetical protein